MPDIQFLHPTDTENTRLLCAWYEAEWHIPHEATRQRLAELYADKAPFHRVLYENGVPVATGGLHTEVNIFKTYPELSRYSPWISLLYTVPEHRGRGLGALLCNDITAIARAQGFQTLYLYTYTAERLYTRLGWQTFERRPYKGFDNALMMLRLD